jgi:hypothetical protein
VKRIIELFDESSEVSVSICWPDEGEPQVRFTTPAGKNVHMLPASTVRLAAKVASDPWVLERAGLTPLPNC